MTAFAKRLFDARTDPDGPAAKPHCAPAHTVQSGVGNLQQNGFAADK